MVVGVEGQLLRDLLQETGESAASVSARTGVSESTLSKLSARTDWLDIMTGETFQRLSTALPELSKLMERRALMRREDEVRNRLGIHHLVVDEEVLHSPEVSRESMQNAMAIGADLVANNVVGVEGTVTHFWGPVQNRTLALVFSSEPSKRLFVDSSAVLDAAESMLSDIAGRAKGYRSALTYSTLAHHLALAGRQVEIRTPNFRSTERSFALRSSWIGRLRRKGDPRDAYEYAALVRNDSALKAVEEWALPSWSTGARPPQGFQTSNSVNLGSMEHELVDELNNLSEPYLLYLLRVFFPTAMKSRPGAFRSHILTPKVRFAISERRKDVVDADLHRAMDATLTLRVS